MKIKLVTIADVQNFVAANIRSNVDITLRSGKYAVDGKSILGIFSLDLMQPIDIDITAASDSDMNEYLETISGFIVGDKYE